MHIEPNLEHAEAVIRGGHPLVCAHCKNDTFYHRSWLLNTAGMTFLNLDWLNQSATNYICSNCGKIEWFTTPRVEGSAFATTDGDSECLSCGEVIPHGHANCPKCGWSYVS
jgi:predicted RNA-binding Zn-ribbon protein involved in translation (DUF1610 family)